MKEITNLIPKEVRNNKEVKKYVVMSDANEHVITFVRNEHGQWTLEKLGEETDQALLAQFSQLECFTESEN